jgi:hypothetical protein
MAEHGVPWLGWMAVGSLVFIAEISCGGKRNLPANSFAHYDDNAKRKTRWRFVFSLTAIRMPR